jgi:hypothetical protein
MIAVFCASEPRSQYRNREVAPKSRLALCASLASSSVALDFLLAAMVSEQIFRVLIEE